MATIGPDSELAATSRKPKFFGKRDSR